MIHNHFKEQMSFLVGVSGGYEIKPEEPLTSAFKATGIDVSIMIESQPETITDCRCDYCEKDAKCSIDNCSICVHIKRHKKIPCGCAMCETWQHCGSRSCSICNHIQRHMDKHIYQTGAKNYYKSKD